MELNEEKKLVVEKLLGKEVFLKSHREDRIFPNANKFDYCTGMGFLATYNPQSDSQATFKDWAEIFEKMDDSQKIRWVQEVSFIIRGIRSSNDGRFGISMTFLLMSSKPSIRWKALIKTLKEVT